MKNLLLAALLILPLFTAHAQHAQGSLGTGAVALIAANQFSKEESLYRAKSYVINNVLGAGEETVKFEAFALASATSGELTTVAYKSDQKQKEGLLLAFYGTRINEMGVASQAYGFKDLPKTKAVELLARIDATLDKESIYLRTDADNNNVSFRYDDLTFLFYDQGVETHMRVFWGPFDAEWNISALRKTERRMSKRI